MIKLLKVLFVLFLLTGVSFAEDDLAFKKGNPAFGVGMNLGFGDERGTGAIVIFDGALNNFLSLGGDAEFDVNKRKFLGVDLGIKDINIGANVRFNFHLFGIPPLADKPVGERHDIYTGFKAGWLMTIGKYDEDIWGSSASDLNKTKNGFEVSYLLGYRFFITQKFHVWTEMGSGWAFGVGF